jgi:YidC/Oxa1 family membrane protein insertase
MAKKRSPVVRILVPLVGLLIGLGIFYSVFKGAGRPTTVTPPPAPLSATPAADGSGSASAAEPAGSGAATSEPAPSAPAAAGAAVTPASDAADVATTGLRARTAADAPAAFDPLGSLDEVSGFFTQLRFTPFGAGIESLRLTNEFETVQHAEHVELQTARNVNGVLAVPFSLLAVEINGQRVDLANVGADGNPAGVWTQTAPGAFRATIENDAGEPVARVDRSFSLEPGRYDVRLRQTLTNLSATPLAVRWIQTGPIDLDKPIEKYGGDKRRIRFGYLLPAEAQAGDLTVTADHDLESRMTALGKKSKEVINGVEVRGYATRAAVWPTPESDRKGRRLVWAGLTDRYFAVVVHPLFDPVAATTPEDKLFSVVQHVDRLALDRFAPRPEDVVMVLELRSPEQAVAPGAAADASMGVYAGPMSRPIVAQDPLAVAVGLDHMVVYNFGGMCAPCTFDWLTHLLLWVLRTFHAITADWALAIILLVVVVRTVLHPITKWSQIRMQRFGAQMQAMGPKQAKLREKFKDDPKKLQAETAKLWKEEGVNPAGMLGCLPMFLQTPVWIALYATLYFAAELRHEPAFYGVFQAITGGKWQFLADLSAPDGAVPLGKLAFTPPLIGGLVGEIRSVNLLPLLLGFVFYVHQKYLTPPTAATLTPEQQQQQKLIKIMSVVLFPVFMYAAPSGLAVYFITNSTLAIFENKWIRAHMDKHDLLNVEKIRAEKKAKGGFIQRLQAAAEARQRAVAEAKNQGAGFGTGKSRAGMYKRAPEKKTIDRKYKRRDD